MAKGMTDGELAVLCDGWIQDARSFDRSEAAASRRLAIDFYEGRVDIASEPNKSDVVSPDVADALEGVLPGLLRVFLSSDRIVIYEPRQSGRRGDGQAGHRWHQPRVPQRVPRLRGAALSGFHDALLHGNGVIKHYWEKAPEYRDGGFDRFE